MPRVFPSFGATDVLGARVVIGLVTAASVQAGHKLGEMPWREVGCKELFPKASGMWEQCVLW